ncbi:Hypothetical protein SMAX5B_007724 [Scophthalmus maximus]|uniref:Uncharacterized protein n=1 Tax=Scophthalmus maximus TaxID=52904 RepID=A0A2U9B297_SCOMX|nr:Hypothetical protein SMAX5B_007724 [Scophthalmus maximus]
MEDMSLVRVRLAINNDELTMIYMVLEERSATNGVVLCLPFKRIQVGFTV